MARGEERAIRAGALLEIALAASFGTGAAWAIDHLRKHAELPMTPFGFRALSGPFEALGQGAFGVLGVALVAVCAVDALAGVLLLQRRRLGMALGLIIAAPQFLLALGFALPFLLVGIPIRIALALAGRRALR